MKHKIVNGEQNLSTRIGRGALIIGLALISAGLSPVMSATAEESAVVVTTLPPAEPATVPKTVALPSVEALPPADPVTNSKTESATKPKAEVPSTDASPSDESASVVQVPLYKSVIVRLAQSAKRISVGNPGIADLISLRGNQMYIIGKALGNTNITAWNADERIISTYDIEVTHDLDTLKKKLNELLPGEKIRVSSAQMRIVLSGQASSLSKMSAAKDLAQSFLPECIDSQTEIEVTDTKKGAQSGATPARGRSSSQGCKEGGVVNLMQIGGAQQVMLEVKVAEMSRTLARRMDANFNVMHFGQGGLSQAGVVSGGATFPTALTPAGLQVPVFGALDGNSKIVGPMVNNFMPNTGSIQKTGLFLGHLSGKYAIQAAIDASRNSGLAKILAEPTLTTLTGQEAEFLSGGEFPIPVPSGSSSGSITVVFKEFGVGVKFLPVVLDSGRINMKMSVSVSELSNAASVVLGVGGTSSTFLIPSLTKRSTSATVELADGQTIGIAGLLNDNLRENVQKFPGLGDIPLLGALFRSQEYQSGQTELVMFVTAHLAKPIAPEQIRLPTESFVPPNDLEFYLMGKLEARKVPEARRALSSPKGGTDHAQFGHQP